MSDSLMLTVLIAISASLAGAIIAATVGAGLYFVF